MLYSLTSLLLVSMFLACADAPEGERVEAGDAVETPGDQQAAGQTFQVNTAASKVLWNASKATGKHNGTLSVGKGTLTVDNGQVTGGEIMLDMQSIVVEDLQGDQKAKLENHLRSGDFFEADSHPAGTFTITKVEAASGENAEVTHQITGNLTLKGISKSVTIPANLAVNDNQITAVTPSFTINRLEWDITYRSGLLGTAADKVINDQIGLVIQLEANAAEEM